VYGKNNHGEHGEHGDKSCRAITFHFLFPVLPVLPVVVTVYAIANRSRNPGKLDSLPYIRDAVLSFQGVTTAT
jgi:hypothetical protein